MFLFASHSLPSDPPVATYNDDVASENGRKADEAEDDADNFQVVTTSGGISRSRTGDGERG